jgi:hypothetical protein
MVLDRIREAKFKLNLFKKCTFSAREVEYLRNLVSADGVSPDASKIKAGNPSPCQSMFEISDPLSLAGY